MQKAVFLFLPTFLLLPAGAPETGHGAWTLVVRHSESSGSHVEGTVFSNADELRLFLSKLESDVGHAAAWNRAIETKTEFTVWSSYSKWKERELGLKESSGKHTPIHWW